MVTKKLHTDHPPQFLDYYKRASASAATIGRFSRIRDCVLMLLEERGERLEALEVADIGCGAGTQSIIWAELGHRVAALDASGALLATARNRARDLGLKIQFSVGFAQALPYEAERFDVVLLPELLEHVTEWEACLREAVRVLKIGGILYLSTSNKLCPVQQEFNLPLYSWYPTPLKRWCEAKATSTKPQWANHTRYPAVNWFSYFGLRRWLQSYGVQTMDRFDILARRRHKLPVKVMLEAVQRVESIRFLAHMATEGTTVWGVKKPPELATAGYGL